jgi:hypothetical protein
MKRVVSVSLGNSSHDHKATLQLLGQEVTVERIGTDGDIEKAIQLYDEIVTNTTTQEDVKMPTGRGVKYLVTTTPRLEGRSFGTNVMEGALVTVAGKGRKLTTSALEELIKELDLGPAIEKLN